MPDLSYVSPPSPTILRVTGSDAATFLHGQFTNDLRSSLPQPVTYGLWLNTKGKVLADSWVLRRGAEEWLVVSLSAPAGAVRERLEGFIIADDVVVADESENSTALVVFGDGAMGACGAAQSMTSGGYAEIESGLAFAGNGGCLVWVGAKDAGLELAKRFPTASGEDFVRWRIRAGVPAIPADLGSADLPQEGGLERNAISFNKGCYLGQEVMARIHSMGQVRRTLATVAGEGLAPVGAAPVFAGAKQVGELRSRAADGSGFIAFAMVQRAALAAGTVLTLEGEMGPALRVVATEASRG